MGFMRKPRADASTHRHLLLCAADAVFSEHGVTASLDLVVARAGLGRATLYRNFANRTALMAALLDRALAMLEAHAATVTNENDALYLLLERFGMDIADSAPLVDFWRVVDRDDAVVLVARKRIAQIFKAPLQRAVDSGLCRADFRLQDIQLITQMLGASLRGGTPAERRSLARRSLQLLRNGMRALSTKDPVG